MSHLSYKTLFIILLFLLIPVVFLIRINEKPSSVSATWWNNSWNYRQAISISNPSGSDLTNFQVSLNIGTSALIASSKMQSDCDDIRITDQNGQELSHWIEKDNIGCNALTDTKIWVKTTTLPSLGTTLYFYYGNSQANNVENGDNVFEFFDAFNGTSIDSGKWIGGTIAATSGTNFAVSSGTLTGGNTNRYLQSTNTFTGNYVAETRVYETTGAANGFTSLGFYSSLSNCLGILIHSGTSYARNDGNWPNFGSFTTAQWEKNYISLIGNTAFVSRTGETTGNISASYTNSGVSNEYLRIGARFDDWGADQNFVAKWDYVFIRKAATSTPTATPATEELRPQSINIGGTSIQTPPGNLIVYYKFDEGAGSTVHNSGTGSSTLDASNVNVTLTNEGKVNKALNFTGASVYYVQSNNSLLLNSGQTYSAWVYHASSGWLEGVLTTHNYVNTSNLGINTSNDHFSISIGYTDGSREYNTKESNYVIVQNKWTHVVLKYDNIENSVSFYINGTFDRKWILNQTVKFTSDKVLLGQWSNEYLNNNYKFSGLIDEAKIYDYPLSDNEIKREYNQSSSVVFEVKNLTVGNTSTSAIYCLPGSTDPCSPPIAEWNFEESVGSTAHDTTSNSNNGILSGATLPRWSVGKIGTALSFNGLNNYVLLPTSGGSDTKGNLGFADTDDFTISLWYKGTDTETGDVSLGKTLVGRNSGDIYANFVINGGYVEYLHYNGSWQHNLKSTSQVTDNKWHHISYINHTSETGDLYIDGIKQISGLSSSIDSATRYFKADNLMNGYSNKYTSGQLDQVRIYNYARTPAQIAWDYNQGAPIGWWKFDECQGAIAHDSSGIGNTGAITIGAGGSQTSVGTCTTSNTAWGVGATGKFNSSLSFDGTDDSVNLGSMNSVNNLSQLAISGWVKRNAANSYGTLFFKEQSISQWIEVVFHSSGLMYFIVGGANVGYGSIPIPTGTSWNFYTCVFDGTQTGDINRMKIYLNGIQQTVTFTGGTVPATTSSPTATAYIGPDLWNSTYLNGLIDDVRIYNYALTSDQVKILYNGGSINFN